MRVVLCCVVFLRFYADLHFMTFSVMLKQLEDKQRGLEYPFARARHSVRTNLAGLDNFLLCHILTGKFGANKIPQDCCSFDLMGEMFNLSSLRDMEMGS